MRMRSMREYSRVMSSANWSITLYGDLGSRVRENRSPRIRPL
jgi:hypothetical protein